MAFTVNGAWAQGGTNSPYSQFGIGVLSDQSQGMGRGMNGVGYGLRQGNNVNTLNPASYSSVDSLTMLFDMGVSGQFTHYEEGNLKRNASLASFEYVVGSFRAWKNFGVSFGLLPYSSVGYEYSSSSHDQNLGKMVESYTGSGGLHEVFVGFGWQLMKPLSIGVNAGYLWGSIDRSVLPESEVAANKLLKNYSTSISNYKLDIGAQWVQPLGRFDRLTLGAVVGIGHNLKNDAEMTIVSSNQLSNSSDTTALKLADAYELPMSFGVGAAYQHGGKLTAAADFTLDKWGDVKYPVFTSSEYNLQSGLLKDRMKMSVGIDWLPNPSQMGGKFLEHVHYRLGAGYATPYYNINGKEGPKELSVSVGFGIPIVNMHNNRSVLNISGQWVRSSATDFVTENNFRINIGITFNERWFMKWKVD